VAANGNSVGRHNERGRATREVAARRARSIWRRAFVQMKGFKCARTLVGHIKPERNALIAVNICMPGINIGSRSARPSRRKKLGQPFRDETGKLVQAESYNEGRKSGAGFSPTTAVNINVWLIWSKAARAAFALVYCLQVTRPCRAGIRHYFIRARHFLFRMILVPAVISAIRAYVGARAMCRGVGICRGVRHIPHLTQPHVSDVDGGSRT